MRFNNIFCAILMLASSAVAVQARTVNVHGVVTVQNSDEPIPDVCVFNAATNKLLTTTNNEGKYMVTVDDDAELTFDVLGFQSQNAKVFGRLKIDIAMSREAMQLEEITVQAKRLTNTIQADPTDLEIKGNYITFRQRVKMPHEMFNSSSRLIIQPDVYNVTSKEHNLLKPTVIDGRRYAITQERMLDFDRSADPLTPYVRVLQGKSEKDDMILIVDSAYVKNPNNDFRLNLMMSIENYNRILYGDTLTTARGSVNPLRFLEFNPEGCYVTDEDYLPTPDLQLRDTDGDINLSFKVGQSKLDLDLGDNRAEVESLLAQIHEIENDPNSALKSFAISGTASPEGRYESNKKLAADRMNSAMATILSNLESSTVSHTELTTDASVESWQTVATMLRADSLLEEADAIERVIAENDRNIDIQSRRIVRLPFYDLLKDKYLTRLRRVKYRFTSSRYRYLTDEEIAEEYALGHNLSRYEFWRLYSLTDDLNKKREIARRALEVHPKFLVAANDLVAIDMQLGNTPDPTALDALVTAAGDKVPYESRANLAAVCMAEGNFKRADSLANLLPDVERFHRLIVYSKARNGRLKEVMQEISDESPFNEVLVLLAVKADSQAWAKAKALGNSPKEQYVKAMAANRVDEYLAAYDYLKAAITLDPSLREIASVDADVRDLLKEIEDEEERQKNEK